MNIKYDEKIRKITKQQFLRSRITTEEKSPDIF